MSDESERLLYVVSAKRDMAWSAFKSVFDQLDAVEFGEGVAKAANRARRNRTARMLDALGHCDFRFGDRESRVSAAPATLVRLPKAGLPAAILVGARSPETRNDVEASCVASGCRLSVSPQQSDLPLVPTRFLVEGDSEEALQALSRTLGIRFDARPASWIIAHLIPTLDEYLAASLWRSDGELNWPREQFMCDQVQFRSGKVEGSATALTRYTNPKRGTLLHLYRAGSRYAEVDCDLGRYAALRDAGLNVLIYDERKQLLVVPIGAPLPRVAARSIVFCSGYPPIFIPKEDADWPGPESRGFDLYRSVPLPIAYLIAEKLGQSLVPRPIRVPIH